MIHHTSNRRSGALLYTLHISKTAKCKKVLKRSYEKKSDRFRHQKYTCPLYIHYISYKFGPNVRNKGYNILQTASLSSALILTIRKDTDLVLDQRLGHSVKISINPESQKDAKSPSIKILSPKHISHSLSTFLAQQADFLFLFLVCFCVRVRIFSRLFNCNNI